MRFVSTAKVLAKRMLKYYRISLCDGLQELFASGERLFEVDYTALKGFLAAANTQYENGKRLFYMYATRGIFYLTNNGYMTLIAIEMIDCPDPAKPDETVRSSLMQLFVALRHGHGRMMIAWWT